MTPHNSKYPRGLPPQYPVRRGSNTPISPLATNHAQSPTPNRSRSLDGLLDSEPVAAKNSALLIDKIPSKATQSCDELDSMEKIEPVSPATDDDDDENKVVEQSPNDVDKVSVKSNSSEKRKRNFMDRCVNKVRSFIRK